MISSRFGWCNSVCGEAYIKLFQQNPAVPPRAAWGLQRSKTHSLELPPFLSVCLSLSVFPSCFLSFFPSFFLSFFVSFILSFFHSFFLSFVLSFFRSFVLSFFGLFVRSPLSHGSPFFLKQCSGWVRSRVRAESIGRVRKVAFDATLSNKMRSRCCAV